MVEASNQNYEIRLKVGETLQSDKDSERCNEICFMRSFNKLPFNACVCVYKHLILAREYYCLVKANHDLDQ